METINKEKIKNEENIKKGLFDKVTSFFEQLKNKHSGIEIIEQEIKKTSDEVNSEVEEATVNNLKESENLEDVNDDIRSRIDLAFDSMQIIDYIDFLSNPDNSKYLTIENLPNIEKNLKKDIKNPNKQIEKIIEKVEKLLTEMIKLKTDLEDNDKKISFLNSLCMDGKEVKREDLDLLKFEFTPFAVIIKIPPKKLFLFSPDSDLNGFCKENNGFNIIMVSENSDQKRTELDIEATKKHEIQHAKFNLYSEVLQKEENARYKDEYIKANEIVNYKEDFLILDQEKINESDDVKFLKNFFKKRVLDEFLAYSTEQDGEFEKMNYGESVFFKRINLNGILESRIPIIESKSVEYLLNVRKAIYDTIGKECLNIHSIIKKFYNDDKYYDFLKNNNPNMQEYEKYLGYGVYNGFDRKKFIRYFLELLTPDQIIEISEEIENTK